MQLQLCMTSLVPLTYVITKFQLVRRRRSRKQNTDMGGFANPTTCSYSSFPSMESNSTAVSHQSHNAILKFTPLEKPPTYSAVKVIPSLSFYSSLFPKSKESRTTPQQSNQNILHKSTLEKSSKPNNNISLSAQDTPSVIALDNSPQKVIKSVDDLPISKLTEHKSTPIPGKLNYLAPNSANWDSNRILLGPEHL